MTGPLPASGAILGLSGEPLTCSLLAPGTAVTRLHLFQGLDRPERLQIELALPGLEPGAVPGPGSPLELRRGESLWFSGAVERASLRWDARGRTATLVAYSFWEALRGGPPQRYVDLTDAEIAERVVSRLGLKAWVEPTRDVVPLCVVEGDPLRFLRERAQWLGFELAVAGDTLYFASRLPSPGTAPRALSVEGELLSLFLEDRGAAGRGGTFVVPADPGWQPLVELDARGLGARWDGRYRAVRVRHDLMAAAWRTAVEFLEQGTDIEAWRRSHRAS